MGKVNEIVFTIKIQTPQSYNDIGQISFLIIDTSKETI